MFGAPGAGWLKAAPARRPGGGLRGVPVSRPRARGSPGLRPRALRPRPGLPSGRYVDRFLWLIRSMVSMRALIVGVPRRAFGAASSALVPGLLVPAIALAQNGPACAPATLNNSALLDGAVTVSPLPGSRDASPQTQISFIGVPAGELSVVSVVGSVTGEHGGRLAAYSQGDGASFLPRPAVRRRGARHGPRPAAQRPDHEGSAGHLRDRASGHDQLHSRDDPSRERRGGPELPLAARPAPAGGDRDRPLRRSIGR